MCSITQCSNATTTYRQKSFAAFQDSDDSDDDEEGEDETDADAKDIQAQGLGIPDAEVGMGGFLRKQEADSEGEMDLSEKSKKRPEQVATLKLRL